MLGFTKKSLDKKKWPCTKKGYFFGGFEPKNSIKVLNEVKRI